MRTPASHSDHLSLDLSSCIYIKKTRSTFNLSFPVCFNFPEKLRLCFVNIEILKIQLRFLFSNCSVDFKRKKYIFPLQESWSFIR